MSRKPKNAGPGDDCAKDVQSAPSRARATVVEAVLEHIRTGTPIRNAFALEDVPKRTAYDWMEADEGLRNAVDKARAIASETRRKVFEAEPSAPMLHYMQTLDPESFPPPKTRTEVSGPEGKPQEHRVVLTTQQRNAGARDGSVPEEV